MFDRSRRRFLQQAAVGLTALALGPSCRRRPRTRAPNLVLFLSDDQRYDTLSCAGHPVLKTPQIDSLAASGCYFADNFVTTSICPISRASIITGQHVRRHRVNDFNTPLPPEALDATFPVLLRRAGYYTGFIGKWGIAEKTPVPRERFDYFEGFADQGQYFVEHDNQRVHITNLMADQAAAFLREAVKHQPFFLQVSFKAPHEPWADFDPALADLYKDDPVSMEPTATSAELNRLPPFLRATLGGENRAIRAPAAFVEHERQYYRLIAGIDLAVGRTLATLRELDALEETVVTYTSDNGMMRGEHGLVGKWLMYEGSIRTPLLLTDFRRPGRRRVHGPMTLNIDLAPTLLELAGQDTPTRMQGRSLLPLARGEAPAWRTDWYYDHPYVDDGHLARVEGVRTATTKYVRYPDQDPPYEQLFDLATDADETRNLATEPASAAALSALRDRLDVLRAEAS